MIRTHRNGLSLNLQMMMTTYHHRSSLVQTQRRLCFFQDNFPWT